MSGSAVTAAADNAFHAAGSGGWFGSGPANTGAGTDCGDGIQGLAHDVMGFLQPLIGMSQQVAGEPVQLYSAMKDWEKFSSKSQTASEHLNAAANRIGPLSGVFADAAEAMIRLLCGVTHSMGDWGMVMGQTLQLCVRLVEAARSLICAGFEMLASVSSLVTEVLFGSWPWEIDKKTKAIEDFASNCRRVVNRTRDALGRLIQAIRELVRLLLNIARALFPLHAQLEAELAKFLSGVNVSGVPFLPGAPGLVPPGEGEIVNPGQTPFPGSDQRFSENFPNGYHHEYDLGKTNLTTEQLNAKFREQFGTVFGPGRVGDNSQLDLKLTGKDQVINAELFGIDMPDITSGQIKVTQLVDDGFTIKAVPPHPEAPGEVAFRLRVVDGRASFEVAGAFNKTLLDRHGFNNTGPAFAAITDHTVWGDMRYRLEDMMNYG